MPTASFSFCFIADVALANCQIDTMLLFELRDSLSSRFWEIAVFLGDVLVAPVYYYYYYTYT